MSDHIHGPTSGPSSSRLNHALHEAERFLIIQDHVAKAWSRLARRLLLKKFDITIDMVDEMLLYPHKYWRTVQKGGKVFYVPSGRLRVIHWRLKRYFEKRRRLFSTAVQAWSRGCSIIENAEQHLGNRSALRLDFENAFESIETKHLFRYFTRSSDCTPPVLLFSRDESWVLSRLLTYRGKLRKGSLVSPILFNMVCARVDEMLLSVAQSYPGTVYTRYGDDMCFSSPELEFPGLLEADIRYVLEECSVVLNERKTRYSKNGRLRLPGVEMIQGRICPDASYVQKMTDEKIESLRPKQRLGHRGFLVNFEEKNVPRRLRSLRGGPKRSEYKLVHFDESDIAF